jgi:hypothetical protein
MSNWAFPGIALVAVVVALLAGCGGGGDTGSTGSSTQTTRSARPANPAACKVGKSALPFVSEPASVWTEGPGPTLALGCLKDSFGGAAIVGFAAPPGGLACVAAYDFRSQEASAELCEQATWTIQCEGHGCIQFFYQEKGFTQLGGQLEAKVKKIKVLVDGKPLSKGVVVAHVEGGLARSIHSKEPFAYFVADVPGCVVPHEVKIELLGAGGANLGVADEWDVPVPDCPQAHRPGGKSG